MLWIRGLCWFIRALLLFHQNHHSKQSNYTGPSYASGTNTSFNNWTVCWRTTSPLITPQKCMYIMRKEPTALPEPLMWIGSGPSPLCHFFLLSSSLNLVLLYKITLLLLSFLSPFMSSDKFLTPAPTVFNQKHFPSWNTFPFNIQSVQQLKHSDSMSIPLIYLLLIYPFIQCIDLWCLYHWWYKDYKGYGL